MVSRIGLFQAKAVVAVTIAAKVSVMPGSKMVHVTIQENVRTLIHSIRKAQEKERKVKERKEKEKESKRENGLAEDEVKAKEKENGTTKEKAKENGTIKEKAKVSGPIHIKVRAAKEKVSGLTKESGMTIHIKQLLLPQAVSVVELLHRVIETLLLADTGALKDLALKVTIVNFGMQGLADSIRKAIAKLEKVALFSICKMLPLHLPRGKPKQSLRRKHMPQSNRKRRKAYGTHI